MAAARTTDRLSASMRMTLLARRLNGSRVSMGEVMDALGDAGLGLTLMLLMLPVFIAIPGLPVGIVFGFAVCLLGLQIAAGAHSVRLPERLRLRTVAADQARRVLTTAAPWLARIERWLRPGRLAAVTGPRSQRLLGVLLVLLGLALAVPIPFGNHAPALAVVALAFGLMERDGLAILVGLVLSAIALAWIGVLIATSAELLAWTAGLVGL